MKISGVTNTGRCITVGIVKNVKDFDDFVTKYNIIFNRESVLKEHIKNYHINKRKQDIQIVKEAIINNFFGTKSTPARYLRVLLWWSFFGWIIGCWFGVIVN